jgi:NADH dehydrogenase [ubiquinone] 1 alpha subcomplex assembly factor 7
MTPLERIIRNHIDRHGPMALHDYMALCLSHPEHGYYITRDPIGATGDFTTAPEVSQMFGELLGLAIAQAWLDQGAPSPFVFAELGPGRGQLMVDALRAANNAPGFAAAAQVWLVETSPTLRAEQAARVPDTQWADSIDTLPDGPLFLLANEFFDALPVHQSVMANGEWRERVIGVKDDKLVFGLGKIAAHPGKAPDGAVYERTPAGLAIAGALAAQIAVSGGAAIIVDYGYDQTQSDGGDTFQAVRSHEYADPLSAPGEADLTAHVNFNALGIAARDAGAATSATVTQGVLLSQLGIGSRAQALASARPEQAEGIANALHRLTDSSQMGNLFKAMAIYPTKAAPPPGF